MAGMEERKITYIFLVGNLRKRDYLTDLGVDGMIILKHIIKEQDERTWILFMWLRMGTSEGLL